jgi:hypothetical protein
MWQMVDKLSETGSGADTPIFGRPRVFDKIQGIPDRIIQSPKNSIRKLS